MATAPARDSAVRSWLRLVDHGEELHRSRAAHLHSRRWTEFDEFAYAFVDRSRDEDGRPAIKVDLTRHFHGVAPEAVEELASPDETANHRPRVDGDLRYQAHAAFGVEALDDAH